MIVTVIPQRLQNKKKVCLENKINWQLHLKKFYIILGLRLILRRKRIFLFDKKYKNTPESLKTDLLSSEM